MAAVVGISKSAVPCTPVDAKLQFLVQLEPAHRAFLGNLVEFLRRTPRRSSLSSVPFWSDVFVASPLPWLGFLESLLWHGVVLASLWVFSQVWLQRPQLITKPRLNQSEVLYYSPSEYLPPIDTGSAPAPATQKGEPELARQPIISVPPEPDNRTQTIITPADLKLKEDVAVPNIVAWSEAAPAPPLAATSSLAHKFENLEIKPIAPAPDVNQASGRRITAPETAVVEPAPELGGVSARQVVAPQSDVIAPPPSVQNELRKLGDINIGHSVVAPAPQLPTAEQRTSAATRLGISSNSVVPPPPTVAGNNRVSTRHMGTSANDGGQVIPPPPSMEGTTTSTGGGRIIALGIHPSATPPPAGLTGNRRGAFAASPEGKSGAPGTPQISATSSRPGALTGDGNGKRGGGGVGSGTTLDLAIPAGIHVGAGPNNSNSSASAGDSESTAPASNVHSGTLLADNHPMRVTVTPHVTTADSGPPTELERSIFGDRKSYSMILNMPNLNSVGGSWIIRFAEKTQSDRNVDVTAPEATRKVDPGYPAELMRQNVQGTVILYAVIHNDGTVGDVRVLSSVDDRLDQFARAALIRWRFKPATRNGNAVDLEAVVTIPFRAKRF